MLAFSCSFLLYFIALFAVAVAFRKKNATASDMLLGDRKLNFWVTALSAQASDMSSWLFMGFPMAVFLGGLPEAWIAFGLVVGMFLTWHYIAPKLRVETERYESFTLSSYFAKRFGDKHGVIRVLSALITFFFMAYYLSAALISIGGLFESLFSMNYGLGIAIAMSVMLGYTFIGGFVSVAWADLFQALFLLGAIVIAPIMAYFQTDGWAAIVQHAHTSNVPMNLFALDSSSTRDVLFSFFGWGLGYAGMPHILIKFMGIKNPSELTKSKYLGIAWQIIVLAAAVAVGLVGMAFFHGTLSNPELVFVEMVKQLFHPFTAGLVLCGVLSATISTMDSQLLVSASVLTEDVYKPLINPRASSRQEVFIFRSGAVLTSLIAMWIASSRDTTIMDAVYYAWAGLGCSFGPLLLSALYAKKSTYQGAIAGILTGALTAAIWPTINGMLTAHDLLCSVPSMIIGFPASLAAIFITSAFTRKSLCAHVSPSFASGCPPYPG